MKPRHDLDAEKQIDIALQFHQTGRFSEAEEIYRRILEKHPKNADALHLLGMVNWQTGNADEAIQLIKKAIAINNNAPPFYNNLGYILKEIGREAEAIGFLNRAIQLAPNFADAHNNLGNALKQSGQMEKAITAYRIALKLQPQLIEAYNNLGNVLNEMGKPDEAIAIFEEALKLRPDHPESLSNLGSVFLMQSRHEDAIERFKQALALSPDLYHASFNLANACREIGRYAEAITYFQRAIEINPQSFDAYCNLGFLLQEIGQYPEALDKAQKALALKPDMLAALNNMGNALKSMGRLAEAESYYRRAVELDPDFTVAHANLLYCIAFQPNRDKKEALAEYRLWDERHAAKFINSLPPFTNDRAPHRRLRVGYVSADFCRHPAAYFIEPILANHDKSQVEIYCYAEVKPSQEDAFTQRFRLSADHWRTSSGLSDEALAQTIRSDGIDILVDLAGHTRGNRLLAFARKPAPIQITYLGYPDTTGMAAMDYRITDGLADPVGQSEDSYVEKLPRMPHSLWCYRPPAEMPEVAPLPALQNGYVTFGSFNNFAKIGEECIELWATLLREIPDSRLLMVTVPDGEARQKLEQQFTERGIAPERLMLHGRLSNEEYHRIFAQVDIGLDPYPVEGGTTTCETLWMGVPVISLVGERFLSRTGLSILSAAGLPDFAAATAEGYIQVAAHLSKNLPLLAEIRAGLRSHLSVSPLMDEVGFTRNLEKRYREIWTQCHQTEEVAI